MELVSVVVAEGEGIETTGPAPAVGEDGAPPAAPVTAATAWLPELGSFFGI